MNGFKRLVANIENLDDAKAEARAARARLMTTVQQIQARTTPAQLLDEALTTVKTRSTELVQNAGEAARKRPGAVVAGAAGIALLLARKPLSRLVHKLLHRGEETADTDRQFNP